MTIGEVHRHAGVSAYSARDGDGSLIDPVLGGTTQHLSLPSGVRIAVVDFRSAVAVSESLCPAGRQLTLFLRGAPAGISLDEGRPTFMAPGTGVLSASARAYRSRVQAQPDQTYRFLSIGFDDGWLGKLLARPTAQDDPVIRLLAHGSKAPYCGVVPLSPDVQRLANDFFSGGIVGACGALIAEARALEIIARVAEAFGPPSSGPEPRTGGPKLAEPDIARLREARALIEREPETAFTLPVLARRVGINVNKLKAGFKQTFGQTVGAYATEVRMAHAYHLLRSEGLHVASVAYRLGYTPTHFAVAFRRRYGVQPSRVGR